MVLAENGLFVAACAIPVIIAQTGNKKSLPTSRGDRLVPGRQPEKDGGERGIRTLGGV